MAWYVKYVCQILGNYEESDFVGKFLKLKMIKTT